MRLENGRETNFQLLFNIDKLEIKLKIHVRFTRRRKTCFLRVLSQSNSLNKFAQPNNTLKIHLFAITRQLTRFRLRDWRQLNLIQRFIVDLIFSKYNLKSLEKFEIKIKKSATNLFYRISSKVHGNFFWAGKIVRKSVERFRLFRRYLFDRERERGRGRVDLYLG